MWREWIEMVPVSAAAGVGWLSPSVWREWIEILIFLYVTIVIIVSLRVEGVD